MTATKTGAVLVVGGGIGGMQSALDLADSGFKVYLVEKKPSIGGTMAQLDKTFPTNDCSMCILAPKMADCYGHPNIHVLTLSEVIGLEGEKGNFKAKVLKKARYVDIDKCTGCGECIEKCPTKGIPNEWERGLSTRKAIYIEYPQAVPRAAVIDPEHCRYLTEGKCGVCAKVCTAGAINYDDKDELIELEVGSVILSSGFDHMDPSIKKEYGYGIYENVVSSMEFERMMSACGPTDGIIRRPSDGQIPRKVAFIQCVGSRDEKTGNTYCSSVCCMYALKEAIIAGEHTEGLEPTIFFMDIRAVGKEFEDYRIRAEKEYGIRLLRGTRVASVEEIPETKNLIVRYSINGDVVEEEFNLVVLSSGLCGNKSMAELSRKLGIDINKYGFCATGTWEPLSTTREGVFVSGAFSAPKDIPTSVAEASGAAAKAGGIIAEARNTLTTTKSFPSEKEIMNEEPRIGVFVCHCGINIASVVNVKEVAEYAKTLPHVVHAEDMLYTCSQDSLEKIKQRIKEHNLNRVVVASCTPRTHEPLFQNTIREAGLNKYLFEMANIRDQCSWIHMHEPEKATKKAKDLVRMAVAKARLLEPLKTSSLPVNQSVLVIGGGVAGMTAALEVAEQGFDVYLVEREAQLGGNLMKIHHEEDGKKLSSFADELISRIRDKENIYVYLNTEVKDITGFVGNFKATLSDGEIEVGAIIVATGAKQYTPTEYLYGQDERVVTQLDFEEMISKGPVTAENVVFIQCVGSRNEEVPYCSRVCCTGAIRKAILIKKQNPSANVYILHKDIRTYGFREELYKEASSLGVNFIRFPEDTSPEVVKEGNDIVVRVLDSMINTTLELRPDLLVLSAGIRPHEDNEELAKMLKVPLSKDGFFLEAHMKLRPVDFATEGVFLAGLAHWPKFVDEAIAQAAGAAARALTIISKDSLETEGIIAAVNEDLCDGCGICEPVCEYKAIEIVTVEGTDRKKAVINEGLCKGCGCCVAACPSGAMEQKGFKTEQMIAVIDAALEGGD